MQSGHLELSPAEHFMALEEAVVPPADAYLLAAQQELERQLKANGIKLNRNSIQHYHRLKRLFFRNMSIPPDSRTLLLQFLKKYRKPFKVSVTEHKNKCLELASLAEHIIPDATPSDEMIEWTSSSYIMLCLSSRYV